LVPAEPSRRTTLSFRDKMGIDRDTVKFV